LSTQSIAFLGPSRLEIDLAEREIRGAWTSAVAPVGFPRFGVAPQLLKDSNF
jgi:hypothetical protein